MLDRLAEIGTDVAQQTDRDELAGIEDEGCQRQCDDAEPALAVGALLVALGNGKSVACLWGRA